MWTMETNFEPKKVISICNGMMIKYTVHSLQQ